MFADLLGQTLLAEIVPYRSGYLFSDWLPVLYVVLAVIAAVTAYCYTTRAGKIARATTKEAIRQPMFPLLTGAALIFLVVNTFLPFFSFGEDVKMLIDCGQMAILVCGLLLAIWTASMSVAEEIEGKTAMTLLSKPITRRQFIVGKYLGIMTAVFWMMIPLWIAFLALVFYKVGYDARESSALPPEMIMRWAAVLQAVPGLILIYCQIAVMAAISVAISTRLPMVVNIVTCFAIFVVGRLTPQFVQGGVLKLEFVQFMGRLIATVLPNLEAFNTDAAIHLGTIVPPAYLGWAATYAVCFSAAVILLAFILFEDRDLA